MSISFGVFRFALLASLVLSLTGCPAGPGTTGQGAAAPKKTRIVTTTAMVTDIVRNVVGDHADVSGLMNEGVDPHLYKPTVADTGKLLEANVIIYSGLGLEGRMESAFEQAGRKGIKVFAATGALDKTKLRQPEGQEGHIDPHVWMDVDLWSQCAAHIRDKLIEIDGAHEADYRKNAEVYLARLKKLDEYAQQAIKSVPEERRYLVTAHDAFSYFAARYGLEVKSVQGITTDSEPGVKDVVDLRKFLVEKKIPAIFVESSVNQRLLQAVIEGAAEDGWKVHVSGTLFSDAMGAEGTYEGTYEGMIDHNVTTIARALGGTAEEKGLNGRLTISAPK
jgi:manganese/zinc/iron transport system substrate-binding protein